MPVWWRVHVWSVSICGSVWGLRRFIQCRVSLSHVYTHPYILYVTVWCIVFHPLSSFLSPPSLYIYVCVCVCVWSATNLLSAEHTYTTLRRRKYRNTLTPLCHSLALSLTQRSYALRLCPSLLLARCLLSLFHSSPLTLFNHVCAHRTVSFFLFFFLSFFLTLFLSFFLSLPLSLLLPHISIPSILFFFVFFVFHPLSRSRLLLVGVLVHLLMRHLIRYWMEMAW